MQTSSGINAGKRGILLVTLHSFNYGNDLQRYALTRTLEGFGFEVTHLCVGLKYRAPSKLEKAMANIKLPAKYILALLGSEKFRTQFKWRKFTASFRAFEQKFMKREIFSSYSDILSADKSQWSEYYCAVTGSDQVWHNWSKTPDELRYYYLEFVPPEKRVCYAPSFGFSRFQEQDIELHRRGLQGFCRLSCREEEMRPMIRALTRQEAELVLDPTLLLSPEQWREVAQKPKYPVPERYVVCYFLGQITPEYQQAIHDMAGGLPVINIHDIDTDYYITHPGEFVYMIDRADFVVTDSFHGTAFSVNLGKNFMAFRRKQKNMEDMFGRIESILTNTGLMNHVYESGMDSRPEMPDSVSVREKLGTMREKSLKYLRECLKV